MRSREKASDRKKERSAERNVGKAAMLLYDLLPLFGTLFCLWYIKRATCDIVYTDYIRLVNSYLPDVWNPAKFFVPDVLTRIPIHYLGRIINVTCFGYSTTFDMALGALGLGLSGLVFGIYCRKKQVGSGWFLFLMFLLFGLDKWEMLTNGTGWGHFMAFAGFYYHYLVFDRVLYGQEKRHDRVRLIVLPGVIILGMAGPYCAVYAVVMVLAYLAAWAMRRRNFVGGKLSCSQSSLDKPKASFWLAGIISVLLPFCLYLWSNSYAVEDHAGAVNIGLLEFLRENPGFFPRFLLKSLASMVVGGETLTGWMQDGAVSELTVYLLGVFLAAGYLLALYLNVRYRLYERTLMPLMLLFAGMGNHAIVLVSRYIFVKENYGMSSRYALQYQAGLLGIVLTFALLWRGVGAGKSPCGNEGADGRNSVKSTNSANSINSANNANSINSINNINDTDRRKDSTNVQRASGRRGISPIGKVAAFLLVSVLLIGHSYTNYAEWRMAPYREEYGRNIEAVAVRFEEVSDEVLRETFDYRKSQPDSGAKVRQALTILKENGWNVFGR